MLKITFNDVYENDGRVDDAIITASDRTANIASGVIGSSFNTSGPGSGVTVTFDASDFATRAISNDYGAEGYVDAETGRVAFEFDEDGKVIWSDCSYVFIDDISIAEVFDYPDTYVKICEAIESGHIEASLSFEDLRERLKRVCSIIRPTFDFV